MNPRNHKLDSAFIVYDADRVQHPDVRLFDPAYWKQQGGLAGEAVGRGSALFLDTPFGETVLRQYLRGGLPGRFIRDRYLFTGWERSRPVAEFNMLARLTGEGLPVPRPIAALARRHGPSYTGSLMTQRIMGALPLADLMVERSGRPEFWGSVGACIRHFHERGVVHADLNARNILVDLQNRVYLIDFDRARIAPGQAAAFRKNLDRLRRSFEKLWPVGVRERLDDCWHGLVDGYEEGGRGEPR